MHLIVFYLRQTYSEDFIKKLLSHLLHFDMNDIDELGSPIEHKLKYEHRYLDETEFNSELSIFCWENDFPQRTGGKLQLGSRLSQAIQSEVLVQKSEDDPHEWVLIDKDRFFVAKEKVGANTGINLLRDEMQEMKG